MIYNYNDITNVHLEISSFCNAECPLCPRNFYGYPQNNGYQEHAMTLKEAQKIFTPNFLTQLKEIHINGNFGDIVMCPEAVDILTWFKRKNPDIKLAISTNGGARNKDFWISLAHLNCQISFCIDGLEDTHSIYRRNTVYESVIKNAETFIAAGGQAIWKFIVFEHNKHQIAQARLISEQMKFAKFETTDHGRNQGPVFNNKKQRVFYLGLTGSTDNRDFDSVYQDHYDNTKTLHDLPAPKAGPIRCQVQKQKSLYINSIGEVYPCCWLGFNPKTFGGTNYFKITNEQLLPLISENNALEYSIEHALTWFDRVADSWEKPTYQQGLLYTCNHTCA
jgi:sulfatase maturation enzyme AslB (radical SAM superfamily)